MRPSPALPVLHGLVRDIIDGLGQVPVSHGTPQPTPAAELLNVAGEDEQVGARPGDPGERGQGSLASLHVAQ